MTKEVIKPADVQTVDAAVVVEEVKTEEDKSKEEKKVLSLEDLPTLDGKLKVSFDGLNKARLGYIAALKESDGVPVRYLRTMWFTMHNEYMGILKSRRGDVKKDKLSSLTDQLLKLRAAMGAEEYDAILATLTEGKPTE